MHGSPNDAEDTGPVLPVLFNWFSYSAPAQWHTQGCSFNFYFFPMSHIPREKSNLLYRKRTQSCSKHTQQASKRYFHTDAGEGEKLCAHNSTICRSGYTLGLYVDILSAEICTQLSVKTVSKNSLFLTTMILINIKITTALAIVHEIIIVSEVKSFLVPTVTKTTREALVTEGPIIKYHLICFSKRAHEKKKKTNFQR